MYFLDMLNVANMGGKSFKVIKEGHIQEGGLGCGLALVISWSSVIALENMVNRGVGGKRMNGHPQPHFGNGLKSNSKN